MLVSRGFSDLLTNLYLYKTRKVNLVFFRFFFPSAYDYISILPYPPTHLVRKRKHFAKPTHLFDYLILEWSLRAIFLFDVSLSHQTIDVSKKLQRNKKVPSQSFLILWVGFVAKEENDVLFCDVYFI